jgi:hypothetical protein
VGAVVERPGLATTSAKPRYAVSREFADLLVQLFAGSAEPHDLIHAWQARHLTAASLGRIKVLRKGASSPSERVIVTLPNGTTRLMHPGPSSIISKAVIEEFTRRFLREPALVFLSESRDKVNEQDAALAKSLGLNLDFARNLPDIIIADVAIAAPKLVFIEVIATDGAVTEQRKQALSQIAREAGYEHHNIYFVSAFMDRSMSAFPKLVSDIAWGTFAWFVSEPDKLLAFHDGTSTELSVALRK